MQSDMVQNYWLKITIQIPREFYFSKHPNIFSFVVPFPGYLPPSPSALSSHAVRSQSVVHGHCDNGLSKTAVRQVSDSVPRFGMVKMWAFEKVVWWPSNYTTQKITLKHLVYIYICIYIYYVCIDCWFIRLEIIGPNLLDLKKADAFPRFSTWVKQPCSAITWGTSQGMVVGDHLEPPWCLLGAT